MTGPPTFETIAEMVGADDTRNPWSLAWHGECPVCGTRRGLELLPDDDGTATVRCISRGDDMRVVLDVLGIDPAAGSFDDRGSFVVPHSQRVAPIAAASESSWAPQDIRAALGDGAEPEQTALLTRSDGVSLLYPGKTHWFMGESESGKSWVALIATAETLNAGGTALFVDFESELTTIGRRLLALGVPLDVLAERFVYVRPAESPGNGNDAAESAFAAVLERAYDVAVVDGITDALMLFGHDMNQATDVADFIRAVPRRIADTTGAAVVCVDHVVKSNDARGRFAIGSQHKLAGLSGAAYVVEPADGGIAPGRAGTLVLRVSKDRPGWVRQHGGEYRKGDRTQEVARVALDSTGDGTTFAVLTPETVDDATGAAAFAAKQMRVMDDVVAFLRAHGSASGADVEKSVRGQSGAIREALGELVVSGVVVARNAARGKRYDIATDAPVGSVPLVNLVRRRSGDDDGDGVTSSCSSLAEDEVLDRTSSLHPAEKDEVAERRLRTSTADSGWTSSSSSYLVLDERTKSRPISSFPSPATSGGEDEVPDGENMNDQPSPGVDEPSSAPAPLPTSAASLDDVELPPANVAHIRRLDDRR